MARRVRLVLPAVLVSVLLVGGLASGSSATAAPGDVTVFSTVSPVDNARHLVLGADGNIWFTNSSGDIPLGRMTPAGQVTPFTPDGLNQAHAITSGPDGNVWFSAFATQPGGGITPVIGRLDPDTEVVDTFGVGLTDLPLVLTPGPDGAIWFTDVSGGIGRVQPDGTIERFAVRTLADSEEELSFDADGNLWTAAPRVPLGPPARLVRTSPAGVQTAFPVDGEPGSVEVGTDGNLWFADTGAIGRMTPTGDVIRFPNDFLGGVRDLVLGGDGNVWFLSADSDRVGRVTPAGAITLFRHSTAREAGHPVLGADGNVWYGSGDVVVRVLDNGVIRTFGGSDVDSVEGLAPGPGTDLWFGSSATGLASITMAGDITPNESVAHISFPQEVLAGPDGNVWFTAQRGGPSTDVIGRVTPTGEAATFGGQPVCRTTALCFHHWGGRFLTLGPDQNLWFLDTEDQVGRATPGGDLMAWAPPGVRLAGLTVGGDANIWITGRSPGGGGRVFRLTIATGRIRAFTVPGVSGTGDLVTGSDGNVWFAAGRDRIGRITPSGTVRTFGAASVTEVGELVAGPDGNVWFASRGRLNHIRPTGRIRSFTHPRLNRAVALTAGGDGSVWFLTTANPRAGRVTHTGQISFFTEAGLSFDDSPVMTPGPDDELWFTTQGERLGRVTSPGGVTTVGLGIEVTGGLGLGPDGNLWIGVSGGMARLELGP